MEVILFISLLLGLLSATGDQNPLKPKAAQSLPSPTSAPSPVASTPAGTSVSVVVVTTVMVKTVFVPSLLFEGFRRVGPKSTTITLGGTSTTSSTDPTPSLVNQDPCAQNIPDTLSFLEPLSSNVKPSDIVIYSGGDSLERRTTGFGNITSTYLKKFTDYHGYNLAFCDELDYDKSLVMNGVKFAPNWHRIFAFKSLMKRFPDAKYVVWLDDDILVPFHETHMLNHYINWMESQKRIQVLIGDDIETQVLNSGMYFARIGPFLSWLIDEIIATGFERDGFYSTKFHHEQSCLRDLRSRHNFIEHVKIIPHREGIYNFNTFVNIDAIKAKPTDAFIHFINMPHPKRLELMGQYLEVAAKWRSSVPSNCTYPMAV